MYKQIKAEDNSEASEVLSVALASLRATEEASDAELAQLASGNLARALPSETAYLN